MSIPAMDSSGQDDPHEDDKSPHSLSITLQAVQARSPHCFSRWRRRCFQVAIISLLILVHMEIMHVNGQVGLIRLEHAYADMAGSTKRNSGRGMSQEHFEFLKAHDRARHSRFLSDVVNFPIGGTANPFVAGIYFTRISLGTPSKDYFVQVDTGSDILWLNCNPCNACPRSSALGMPLIPYDPHASSSSTPMSCRDPNCDYAIKITNAGCDYAKNCGYRFLYGDGSTTTGYLVADTLLYNTVQPNNTLINAEARIIFGCGYSQSGDLLTSERALDGIMGFGQNDLSVISQLYSQGKTRGIFAHCLQGADTGGSILVLGNVIEPGMVFTPIVPSQMHYNVNLRGISVNRIALSVDASAYDTTNVQGTIFDSGTTLTYLMETAYVSFVEAIIKGAPKQAQYISSRDNPCFLYAGSVDDAFPLVTLHFEGADMNLKGSHYLIQQADNVNDPIWCIGWQPISPSTSVNGVQLTILGDLVLKNQLVVYDLENQRIGWVDFDCSTSVAVSTTTGKSESVSSHRLGSHAFSITEQLPSALLLCIATVVINFFCRP